MSASYFDLLKYAATGIASPSMTYFDKMRASTLMGGGTVQTLTGQPPLSFKADGTPLISWSMKGNGSQQGTPTPDNPVMPEFVGVKTGNLCNVSSGNTLTYSGYNKFLIDDDAQSVTTTGNALVGFPTPVEPSTAYTVYANSTKYGMLRVREYSDKPSEWAGAEYIQQTVNSQCGYAYNFTTTAQTKWIAVAFYFDDAHVGAVISDIMLNSGSTALPYEPFGYKIPISCGGENLFDSTVYTSGYNIAQSGEIVQNSNYSLSGYIFVTAGTYTLSGKNTYNTTANIANRAILYDVNKENPAVVLDATGAKPVDFDYTIQIPKSGFLVFSFRITDINIMLNLGSTAKPYAPYSRQTTPVYLGHVSTVRRVQKMVLTGSEAIGNYNGIIYLQLPDDAMLDTAAPYSTHYSGTALPSTDAPNYSMRQMVTGYWGGRKPAMQIKDSSHNSSGLFQDFISNQYAAGTPVLIWYVLAEPETTIVNEPLCKIGDFSDELSSTDAAATIPTVKGSNTLTVDTELQPSEMTITFKG